MRAFEYRPEWFQTEHYIYDGDPSSGDWLCRAQVSTDDAPIRVQIGFLGPRGGWRSVALGGDGGDLSEQLSLLYRASNFHEQLTEAKRKWLAP